MPIDPLERYFPFDAGDGQYVSEIDWGTMAKHWANDGVAGSTALAVSPTPLTPFSVRLAVGDAFVSGFFYHLGVIKDLVVPNWSDGTGPRLDYVALKLDNTANTLAPVIVIGTKNTLPALPANHLPLATISVSNVGGITVTQDLRAFIGSRILTFSSVGLGGLPPAPMNGDNIAYDTILGLYYRWNGSSWVHVWGTKKTAATIAPVAGSGSGTWTLVQFPGAEAYGLYEATVMDNGVNSVPYLRVRVRTRSSTVVAVGSYFAIGDVTLPAGYGGTTTPITGKLLTTAFARRTWPQGQYSEGKLWLIQTGSSVHVANEYFEVSTVVPLLRSPTD